MSSLQLLGMARGVSSGMTYLSEGGFIHRVCDVNWISVLSSVRYHFWSYISLLNASKSAKDLLFLSVNFCAVDSQDFRSE